ncbi:hypothetical protein HanRHA438_Chr15g0701161 [Helianthus annuus]|uniref:Uncharacterized protein n=1 Tax=Helianthus annuus TaxID=4232 RepID=A0A251S8G9_HELAN|nr:hypothetical protein HanXRQr2_Chr15g0688811 [Helianthus annuus]KAJ0455205.1 hypothetical protein HanIR_Chr15g0748551 [Helianthus annuus]KAJ0844323.1 hypothetical protein HanRHA438_Chr15g0701161 [Helianthus annuus]
MYTSFSTLLLPSGRKFAGIVNQKIFPISVFRWLFYHSCIFVCKKSGIEGKGDKVRGRC